MRCAVSVDNKTGKITPHLKQNFQWIRRGERYSLPSPLSKNQKKLQGNGGYQHNKENRHKSLQTPLILNEDQKEYQRALKMTSGKENNKIKCYKNGLEEAVLTILFLLLGTRLETLVSKWDAEDMQTLPKRKESSYIYTDV